MGRLLAKIVHPDSRAFVDLLSILSEFLDEANMEISEEGIRFAGMSPHKTSYIEALIPRQALFTIEVSDTVRAGVDLRAVSLIPRGKKGTPIEISVYEDEVEFVTERSYTLRLRVMNIEIIEESRSIEVKPVARIVMMADALRKIFSDIKVISDNLEISIDGSSATFSAAGERSKAVSKVSRDSATLMDLHAEQKISGIYEASQIERVLKMSRVMETAELSIGSEGQLEIRIRASEGTVIRFVTAPMA